MDETRIIRGGGVVFERKEPVETLRSPSSRCAERFPPDIMARCRETLPGSRQALTPNFWLAEFGIGSLTAGVTIFFRRWQTAQT